MKHKFIFIITAFAISTGCIAQTSNTSQQLAWRQAQKMKDSVGISSIAQQQIYAKNLQIVNNKQLARTQFASDSAQMRIKIQFYENQRDSLYHTIITSEQQFQLYKSKKRNILSNN